MTVGESLVDDGDDVVKVDPEWESKLNTPRPSEQKGKRHVLGDRFN